MDNKKFKVNADKIKTLDDVKLIIKVMDLHYSPKTEEDLKEVEHLMEEVKPFNNSH